MSESGWTTGAAEPPISGSVEEVRPLNQLQDESVGDVDAHSEHLSDDREAGPSPDHDAPARSATRLGPGALIRLKREARFGIAALLSFLILVTTLIVHKWKGAPTPGKPAPLASIQNPRSSSQAATSTAGPASPGEHPENDRDHHNGRGRVVSETPPPPPPAGSALAAAPVASPAQGPAPRVPEPVAKPIQLATTANEPSPSLPLPSPSQAQDAPEPAPRESTSETAGTEAPADVPGADSPSGASGSLPMSESLPPANSNTPEEMPLGSAPPSPAPLLPNPAESEPRGAESRGNIDGPPPDPPGSALPPAAPEDPSTPAPAPAPAPEPSPMVSEPSPAGNGGPGVGVVAPETVPPFVPISSTPAGAGKPDPVATANADRSQQSAAGKKGQAPPAQRRQPLAPSQSATVFLPSGGPNRTSEVPNFSVPPESFEPVVAKPPTMNPFTDAGVVGAGQGGWVALPNTANHQAIADEATARGGDGGPGHGPVGNTRNGAGDLVEPVPHIVRSGENFWTIARLYYGSGRFYKALWKANSEQVGAPEKLRVGQTIRIPPPEALERALVLPPRTSPVSDAAPSVHRTSRPVLDAARGTASRRPAEVELALPVADPFNDRRTAGDLVPAQGASGRPRAQVYKIHPHETLRSIARDTLGDSRRAAEILELNRDVIDDPNHPTPGQLIDLPADARMARRSRRVDGEESRKKEPQINTDKSN